jgi:formate dehydrogenase assembly factor FdhD
MLRSIITRWAKLAYRSKMEKEAGLQFWMGKVQQAKGAAEKDKAAEVRKDADQRESRIKAMAQMESIGYWDCENGHEKNDAFMSESVDDTTRRCVVCNAPAKFISRATMSGQEKYESDKARKEAEDLLADLRNQIEVHEKQAGVHNAAADYFMNRAKQAWAEADDVRRV